MSANIIPYSELFLSGLIFAVFSVGIRSMNIFTTENNPIMDTNDKGYGTTNSFPQILQLVTISEYCALKNISRYTVTLIDIPFFCHFIGKSYWSPLFRHPCWSSYCTPLLWSHLFGHPYLSPLLITRKSCIVGSS